MAREPYPGERPKDWVAPEGVTTVPPNSSGKKVAIGCAAVAGILVVLTVIGAAISDGKKDGAVTSAGAHGDVVESAAESNDANEVVGEALSPPAPPPPPENDPEMTAAEFAQLRQGMSYDEAVAVIGSPGELSSETEMAGYRTQMYSWEGEGSFGANANAMFQNGKLISKAQFGLE